MAVSATWLRMIMFMVLCLVGCFGQPRATFESAVVLGRRGGWGWGGGGGEGGGRRGVERIDDRRERERER